LQGFKPEILRSQGRPQGVRSSLQARADLRQFARREVDALLLRIRALANGAELVGHALDRLSKVGKLAGDERRVISLRHLPRRDSTQGSPGRDTFAREIL
jgi:hypothetical protein